MGKHKFHLGYCEYCGGNADSLPKDENGKFNPCSEAPDGQGNGLLLLIINVYLYLFPHTFIYDPNIPSTNPKDFFVSRNFKAPS